jgi:hypothetical protein
LVGKLKAIHDTLTQIKPEILKLECPKAVTAVACKKELMATLVDILTLPGKLNLLTNTAAVEGSLMFNQFTETVGDLKGVCTTACVGMAKECTQQDQDD